MVAFELAELQELAGHIDRAIDWYKQAWERFRRSEWKKKAEDALARHGIAVSSQMTDSQTTPLAPGAEAEREAQTPPPEFLTEPEGPEPGPQRSLTAPPKPEVESGPENGPQIAVASPSAESAGQVQPSDAPEGRSRRRRRGGRGRGRRGRKPEEAPAAAVPETPSTTEAEESRHRPPRARETEQSPAVERPRPSEHRLSRESVPSVHVYRRVGEPALASEIKSLEAKLRQLLAAHPDSLEYAQELPASPGVYVISDHDLTTFYYVEQYGNIRAAVDQMLSGRRGRQGSVRARLARYLGISDSQTAKYLKQHCVVRWLEMEESDAVALGHFAIAVLRPKLNEEEV